MEPKDRDDADDTGEFGAGTTSETGGDGRTEASPHAQAAVIPKEERGVNPPARPVTDMPTVEMTEANGNAATELMDAGFTVVCYRNALGTITAQACEPVIPVTVTAEEGGEESEPTTGGILDMTDAEDGHTADDFTAPKALTRLAEKVLRKKIVHWTGAIDQQGRGFRSA